MCKDDQQIDSPSRPVPLGFDLIPGLDEDASCIQETEATHHDLNGHITLLSSPEEERKSLCTEDFEASPEFCSPLCEQSRISINVEVQKCKSQPIQISRPTLEVLIPVTTANMWTEYMAVVN